jgi:outer membrane lipoprotein LolB
LSDCARFAAFALVVTLAACATRPVTVPLESSAGGWELRRDALAQRDNWGLLGRVSVTVEEQGWHANLEWLQQGSTYELGLSGPLNQGRLSIAGGPRGVTAHGSDGSVVAATDAESLLTEQLGWSLPVAGMRYWVLGIPDPSQPVVSMTLDELGRLATLEQSGWVIRYPSYIEGDGLDLPHKIRFDSTRVKVRMVIDEWTETQTLAGLPGLPQICRFTTERFLVTFS